MTITRNQPEGSGTLSTTAKSLHAVVDNQYLDQWSVNEYGDTTYVAVATFFRSRTGVVHASSVRINAQGEILDCGYCGGKKVTGGLMTLRSIRFATPCDKCHTEDTEWVETELVPHTIPEGFDTSWDYTGNGERTGHRDYLSPALRSRMLAAPPAWQLDANLYTDGYEPLDAPAPETTAPASPRIDLRNGSMIELTIGEDGHVPDPPAELLPIDHDNTVPDDFGEGWMSGNARDLVKIATALGNFDRAELVAGILARHGSKSTICNTATVEAVLQEMRDASADTEPEPAAPTTSDRQCVGSVLDGDTGSAPAPAITVTAPAITLKKIRPAELSYGDHSAELRRGGVYEVWSGRFDTGYRVAADGATRAYEDPGWEVLDLDLNRVRGSYNTRKQAVAVATDLYEKRINAALAAAEHDAKYTICPCCQDEVEREDLVPATHWNGTHEMLCAGCASSYEVHGGARGHVTIVPITHKGSAFTDHPDHRWVVDGNEYRDREDAVAVKIALESGRRYQVKWWDMKKCCWHLEAYDQYIVAKCRLAEVRGDRWTNAGSMTDTRPEDPPDGLEAPDELHAGDRVQLKKRFLWDSTPIGTTGTFEGGAEYVPGLDAGQYTVKLDEPDAHGRLSSVHWTLDEVKEHWERIPEPPVVDNQPATGPSCANCDAEQAVTCATAGVTCDYPQLALDDVAAPATPAVPVEYRGFVAGARIADNLGTVVGTIVGEGIHKTRVGWAFTVRHGEKWHALQGMSACATARRIASGALRLLPPESAAPTPAPEPEPEGMTLVSAIVTQIGAGYTHATTAYNFHGRKLTNYVGEAQSDTRRWRIVGDSMIEEITPLSSPDFYNCWKKDPPAARVRCKLSGQYTGERFPTLAGRDQCPECGRMVRINQAGIVEKHYVPARGRS